MCDNRTNEFLSFAKTLPGSDRVAGLSLSSGAAPGQPTASASEASASAKAPAYAELRNFHKTAGDISRDIATTSQLLGQLTNLVRHKSMFDDDSAQINNLVVRIKSSIENLNARLDTASYTIQQQKRQVNSQAGQEASNLVDGLKTEFAQAASGFKRVLQQRTDNLKESEDWQRSVYGKMGDDSIPNISLAPPPVYSSAPASINQNSHGNGNSMVQLSQQSQSAFPTLDLTSSLMATGEPTGGPSLPRPHGIQVSQHGSSSSYTNNPSLRSRRLTHGNDPSTYYQYGRANSAPLTPLDIQRSEQEQSAAGNMHSLQLIPDQSYLRERADAMSTVESNIVELGTIFNKLAVMVSEHQELVQRVEDNVEDAHASINLSLGVLTDTLMSLRTNRMLALKVFSILVAFIVMFIIFFA
jgi:syntaxin 5